MLGHERVSNRRQPAALGATRWSSPSLVELARSAGMAGEPGRPGAAGRPLRARAGRWSCSNVRMRQETAAGKPAGRAGLGGQVGRARCCSAAPSRWPVSWPAPMRRRGDPDDRRGPGAGPGHQLKRRAASIAGGTNEIQRGDHRRGGSLALPKEPQVDRDVPFREPEGRHPAHLTAVVSPRPCLVEEGALCSWFLDSEQRELRSAVRKFPDRPVPRRRRSAPRWPPSWATTVSCGGGWLSNWGLLGTGGGRSSTAVPGAGHVERAVVAEETGTRRWCPRRSWPRPCWRWTHLLACEDEAGPPPSCCPPLVEGGADRHRGGGRGRWAVGNRSGGATTATPAGRALGAGRHQDVRAGRGCGPTWCWSTPPPPTGPRLVSRWDSPLHDPRRRARADHADQPGPHPAGWLGLRFTRGRRPARWPAPTRPAAGGPGHRPWRRWPWPPSSWAAWSGPWS